jgi:hypothetical protein
MNKNFNKLLNTPVLIGADAYKIIGYGKTDKGGFTPFLLQDLSKPEVTIVETFHFAAFAN